MNCKHGITNAPTCGLCEEEEKRESGFVAARGSLPGLESEFLIARWEAKAEQCEQTAEQFRTVTQSMLCSYLEKARAYRICVADLRRHMDAANKRQPEENAEVSEVAVADSTKTRGVRPPLSLD